MLTNGGVRWALFAGVMAERLVQDLPKHLKTLQETAMVLGSQVAERLWDLKSEVERRINEMSAKPDEKAKSRCLPVGRRRTDGFSSS